MKKRVLFAITMVMVFMFGSLGAQNLHQYSAQEVLNLVINDGALGTHFYSVQEALNLVFDSDTNALKVTLDDYSVKYGSFDRAYPKSITSGLSKFCKPRFI